MNDFKLTIPDLYKDYQASTLNDPGPGLHVYSGTAIIWNIITGSEFTLNWWLSQSKNDKTATLNYTTLNLILLNSFGRLEDNLRKEHSQWTGLQHSWEGSFVQDDSNT